MQIIMFIVAIDLLYLIAVFLAWFTGHPTPWRWWRADDNRLDGE